MKKILSMILVVAMVLSLCACGGNGGEGETTGTATVEGLQVGYARESITPRGGVPLAGYGNDFDRISTGFIDYIYITCIAFTEGDRTVLLFTEDMMGMSASSARTFGEGVAAATGVPKENIIFCDTHTHYAPTISNKTEASTAYMELFAKAAVTAAQNALADRAPATLYGTKTQTEGMNFTRHYKQEDGSITSSNLGTFDKDTAVGHARVADPEMVLIKAEREGDKKDIMLMNWQAHPCYRGDANSTNISADYIGTTRDAFEKQTGMDFAFFQGASGDVGTNSNMPGMGHNLSCEEFGAKLAGYAVDAMANMQKIEGSGIETYRYQLNYACNHFGEDKINEAKQVMALYEQTKNNAAASALAVSLGLLTYTHARGIVNAQNNPAAADMELNAVCVGGVAFASVPWEMFSETGIFLKENSPFEYTMVLGLANGKTNYVPTREAFQYGCYESFSAYYGEGAAEAAADQLITMLKSFQ